MIQTHSGGRGVGWEYLSMQCKNLFMFSHNFAPRYLCTGFVKACTDNTVVSGVGVTCKMH